MSENTGRKGTGRRRALKVIGGFGLAGLGGGAFALTPARGNAYYQGPVSDHFDGLRFFNPGGPGPKSFRQLLKWQLGSPAESWPDGFASPFTDTPPPRVDGPVPRVACIGHASFLIQAAGRNILIDPVYAERASPVTFAGPKRANPPGIAFAALPVIDTILLTHNHYDHMDIPTIGRLWAKHRPRIITPLGNDTILRNDIAGLEAQSVDWWDTVEIARGVRVHAVPTQHWSARGTRDRLHALWASFVLETPGHTLYCVGDSGFGDGKYFREIAARHPRIDLALLPIGAYEPRWFMRDQHMDPADAVAAMEIVGARRALGHHWGTFKLTAEGVERPREALAAALAARAIPPEQFTAVMPGQVVAMA